MLEYKNLKASWKKYKIHVQLELPSQRLNMAEWRENKINFKLWNLNTIKNESSFL